MPRVLLLLATTTYRAEDFLEAAARQAVDVVVGSDQRQALEDLVPGSTLELDLSDIDGSVDRIASFSERYPLDAIIAAEDPGVEVAAAASARLGLPHNAPAAVRAARYKDRMRRALAEAGVPSPAFRVFSTGDDPREIAGEVAYPCVLKPVFLAASRGVIRADEPADFVEAFRRIAAILADPELRERGGAAVERVLVEDYVPGREVALEGVLQEGELRVLALFDKPDPLEGPYFEETFYVRPSRLPGGARRAVRSCVAETARALGLRHGPVHAELRINDDGVWAIEIAPRSIGGLCSRALRFGAGISLEELILRHAVGAPVEDLTPEALASGVLMLPIRERGLLQRVDGIEEAQSLPGVEGVEITIPRGAEVVPLPEGHRYLGFVFATGDTSEAVERALRAASRCLDVRIGRGGGGG